MKSPKRLNLLAERKQATHTKTEYDSVTKKWEIFGETASTHLICESETQLYDKVQKLGGTIVTRVCQTSRYSFSVEMGR